MTLQKLALEPAVNASSLLLEMARRTRARQQRDESVISLVMGQPDAETPDFIKQAAIDSMRRGETRYTAPEGTGAVIAAVRRKYSRDYDVQFGDDEIVVSNGALQVISLAFQATLKPADEVILPRPYWSSYVDVIEMFGGRVVPVPCSHGDAGIDVQALDAAITPRTRWLVLNFPTTPSGAVASGENLLAVSSILLKHPHLLVLSDDIYERILFDGRQFRTVLHVAPHLRPRVLSVNGVSKAYAMTGWRLGFGAGPAALISQLRELQSRTTWAPCSISQAAAAAALDGPQDFVDDQQRSYEARRNMIVTLLNEIPGMSCENPGGAFYAFPDVSGVLGKRTPSGEVVRSAVDLAFYLLDEARVAVVPGEAFGEPGHLRLTFAASPGQLTAACRQIRSACAVLS
jgi:aspartate aminotransferase